MREELVGWKARRASPTRQSFCPPLSMQPSTIKQQTVHVFLSVYTILTLCYKIPASKGGGARLGRTGGHPSVASIFLPLQCRFAFLRLH